MRTVSRLMNSKNITKDVTALFKDWNQSMKMKQHLKYREDGSRIQCQ